MIFVQNLLLALGIPPDPNVALVIHRSHNTLLAFCQLHCWQLAGVDGERYYHLNFLVDVQEMQGG